MDPSCAFPGNLENVCIFIFPVAIITEWNSESTLLKCQYFSHYIGPTVVWKVCFISLHPFLALCVSYFVSHRVIVCVFLYSFLTLLCFLFALFHLPVHLPFAFMWQRNSCLVQGIRLARQSGCRLRRARTLSSLSHIQARTHTPLSYSHTSHMLTSI